jgi:hypothetical protein
MDPPAIGKSKLLSTCGYRLKQRLETKGAERTWIHSVCVSNPEATIAE